eukprot:CAMPEP_0175128378 /NCGR_PEP_ID=MMETSP0087-20121206/4896_1 /TAXON_ID=136419 /ORGANISM="Unknown Unknown, Strain D1" /LENGTH=293 /DNA_ID=CAMNT_0016410435 /DNA_START=129 /DNA_END=1006 /DNA_ORIENTATION=+
MGESWPRSTLAEKYAAMVRPGEQKAVQEDQEEEKNSKKQKVQGNSQGTGIGEMRLPAYFLPHGAPPLPIRDCSSARYLQQFAAQLPFRPTGIVFMSPHHYEDEFTASASPDPETLMDFDEDTDPVALKQLCQLRYPCKGCPELAARVQKMCQVAELSSNHKDGEFRIDPNRGLDHGIWTVLYVAFPSADIPVVSLSVRKDLDAKAHMELGRALAPLADEGILLTLPSGPARDKKLLAWKDAPFAAKAHPMTSQVKPGFSSPGEHLMPWFFAYGAGGVETECVRSHREYLGSLP